MFYSAMFLMARVQVHKFAGSKFIRHIHVAHLSRMVEAIIKNMMFKTDPISFSEQPFYGWPEGRDTWMYPVNPVVLLNPVVISNS